ncbi:unnamed protein product [Eruca vesicaria subsp. sativa]|uniref:PPM-type phosphatase domain-containing protein n=1 Tax=Eruca vesicaria subsp. sativa TaxID=29727 RepID=A0ABC8ITS0_ERUVS|nr:unnamed protein product [Eruca vesicaria subsp. sativa]
MGSSFSSVLPCFNQSHRNRHSSQNPTHSDQINSLSEPLDETLGHSYCYVPSSNRFLSPFPSDRFTSPTGSFRLSPGRIRSHGSSDQLQTGFRAISGASVSANASNSKTVFQLEDNYDDATVNTFGDGVRSSVVNANGFEGTSSFSALPLQTVPLSGHVERTGLFMSGPIERGATSGPLDLPGDISRSDSAVHFSAPLGGGGGVFSKKRRKRKRSLSRPWVLPVSNFVGGAKRENTVKPGGGVTAAACGGSENELQWALGKAGEDRVQLAVFEKQGWLFAGIYDGFNGPDAPEFLMANLYRAVHSELQGLFWELEEEVDDGSSAIELEASSSCPATEVVEEVKVRKKLHELLAEAQAEDALDLSGSDRFAFSVDDAAISGGGNAVSVGSKRWLLLSKLKQGLSKKGMSGRKLFPRKFGVEGNETEVVGNVRVEEAVEKRKERRKAGAVDHELVLKAMSNGLEATEQAFLEMTEKVLETNPELALMGSCLLVALMRDDDVYVMNIGDSRALVAQYQVQETGVSVETGRVEDRCNDLERNDGNKETSVVDDKDTIVNNETPSENMKLVALQLTTDHSTSIEDEVTRIKNEHPDDNQCIVNDRVKGRLKVTRAFGAGFLKQPKLNDSLLEMFRNEYIGTDPYISCTPSLRHYRLTESDQFMVLSSDGLYQYLSNEEVVSLAMEKFPDGDPAQHVIQELLVRAAKKAGMGFHELLDIPQGDRRKYHDDCTVLVIALGGSRIWKSSGKYL